MNSPSEFARFHDQNSAYLYNQESDIILLVNDSTSNSIEYLGEIQIADIQNNQTMTTGVESPTFTVIETCSEKNVNITNTKSENLSLMGKPLSIEMNRDKNEQLMSALNLLQIETSKIDVEGENSEEINTSNHTNKANGILSPQSPSVGINYPCNHISTPLTPGLSSPTLLPMFRVVT